MSRKSPSQSKILNDTLDLMTLMTHAVPVSLSFCVLWIILLKTTQRVRPPV